MDSRPSNPSRLSLVGQEEAIDVDEVPPEYRDEVHLDPRVKGKARPQSQTTHQSTRNQSTMPTNQAKKVVGGGHSPGRLTPTKEPQGNLVTLRGWVTPKRSSPKPDPGIYGEEHPAEDGTYHLNVPIEVSEDNNREAHTQVSQDEVTELQQSFQISVNGVQYEQEARERELEQRIHNLQHERDTRERELEQHIHNLQHEREAKEQELKEHIHNLQHVRETRERDQKAQCFS
jgi:hypothetical protein